MIAATAITNVRVFDGERLREPATVVLDDGTISARTSADGALNADVVDGGGGTLLPGLIDTHVHVDKVSQLEASASWGVTTMLDMGNKDLANLATLKNGRGFRPSGVPVIQRARRIRCSSGRWGSSPSERSSSSPTLTMMQGVAHVIGGRFAMRVLAPFVPAVRLNYRHAKSTVATFRDAGAVILAGCSTPSR